MSVFLGLLRIVVVLFLLFSFLLFFFSFFPFSLSLFLASLFHLILSLVCSLQFFFLHIIFQPVRSSQAHTLLLCPSPFHIHPSSPHTMILRSYSYTALTQQLIFVNCYVLRAEIFICRNNESWFSFSSNDSRSSR